MGTQLSFILVVQSLYFGQVRLGSATRNEGVPCGSPCPTQKGRLIWWRTRKLHPNPVLCKYTLRSTQCHLPQEGILDQFLFAKSRIFGHQTPRFYGVGYYKVLETCSCFHGVLLKESFGSAPYKNPCHLVELQ